MPFQQNNPGEQYHAAEGHWKCAQCGAEITQLPFEPDAAHIDSLFCRDCLLKKRQERMKDKDSE